MLGLVGIGVGLYAMELNDAPGNIDQSKLCVVQTDQDAMQCEEGNMMLTRFTQGDPARVSLRVLNTAALYCDTNHSVTTSDAGVFCVITHERMPTAQQSSASSDTGSGAGQADSSNTAPEG